jgi:hypothetical protein
MREETLTLFPLSPLSSFLFSIRYYSPVCTCLRRQDRQADSFFYSPLISVTVETTFLMYEFAVQTPLILLRKYRIKVAPVAYFPVE